MKESIITGVFTLIGALIGALLTYFGNKRLVKFEEAKKDIIKLSNQVISYWHLEKEYYEVLAIQLKKPAKTIQSDFRKKVEEKDFDRPILTENEINRIINKWN